VAGHHKVRSFYYTERAADRGVTLPDDWKPVEVEHLADGQVRITASLWVKDWPKRAPEDRTGEVG